MLLLALTAGYSAPPTAPARTTISDVVYRADGTPATGTLVISWPAFTTADLAPVAAGSMSVPIGPGGVVNLSLVPNEGADPAGTYYKVVLKLAGDTSTEYWTVPATSPTTISAIRATVMPAGVAVQAASRAYVDTAVAGKASDAAVLHKSGDETITGVKQFSVSPVVPTPTTGQGAANKDYVDTATAGGANLYVQKTGDTLTGPLTLSGDPSAPGHAANRHYVDTEIAVVSGGLAGKADIGHAHATTALSDVDAGAPTAGQTLVYDGAKYKPVSGRMVDVVRDCGAVGDGATDDRAAIQACITNHPGKIIFFPKTRPYGTVPDYYIGTAAFSNAYGSYGLVMSGNGQALEGDSSAFAGGSGTTIKFAAGLTGVTIPNSNTQTYGGFAGLQPCQGPRIENIVLQGSEPYDSALHAILPAPVPSENFGPATGASTADGVRIAANYTSMRNVEISYFGRHGIYLDGNSGAPWHAFADNANLDHVVVTSNRGSGIYNRGSDSNASVFTMVSARANQLFGVEDYSFLGTVWVAPHTDGNHWNYTSGVATYTISSISNTGNVTTATLTGNHNLTVGMAVVISGTTNYNGTRFVASTPANNSFTFAQTSPVGSESSGTVTNATSAQVWAAAGNDANIGGAYRADSGAMRSVWLGPYSESNQGGVSQFSANQIILGGDLGQPLNWNGFRPSWFQAGPATGLVVPPFVSYSRDASGNQPDASIQIGGGNQSAADGNLLNIQNGNAFAAPSSTKGTLSLRLTSTSSSGWIGWRCCSSSDSSGFRNYALLMSYGGTTETVSSQPVVWIPTGYYMGNTITTNRFFFSVATTKPTGACTINDIVWNDDAAGIQNVVGWRCTNASGTWTAFGGYNMMETVAFSATPTFDCLKGNLHKITLTNNVTSSTLFNCDAGQPVNMLICQDSGGAHTFTWPSTMKGGMTVGSTASKCSAQSFVFDGINAYATSSGVINQ